MSFVSANDHPTPVSPQDPLYYAPPSVRNKADPLSKEIQQMGSHPLPATSSVSHSDKMREEAFAKFTRPLEPEFVYERGRPRALIAIAGGIGAAIAATAIGAFVFFTVSPKSKSESSELTVSISTPASAAPAQATSEDSEALLQGFMKFQTIQGKPPTCDFRTQAHGTGQRRVRKASSSAGKIHSVAAKAIASRRRPASQRFLKLSLRDVCEELAEVQSA